MAFLVLSWPQGEQALVSGDLLHKFCRRCSEPTGCRWLLDVISFDLSTRFMYRPGSGMCLVARTYCVSLQDLGVSSRAWPVLRVNFILWLQTWLVLKIDSGSLRHLIFGFQFFKFTDAPAGFSPGSHQLFLNCPMKARCLGCLGTRWWTSKSRPSHVLTSSTLPGWTSFHKMA